MLNVQEYLKKFSLSKLSQEFFIDTRICNDLNLVCLDYQLYSPLENPIVQECRCLILEIDTWDVACKAFGAFYEYDASADAKVLSKFDWNSAKAMVKYDGALIVFYYYKDEWRIGMRKSADGSIITTAINGVPSTYTFAELVKITLSDMGYTWSEFTKNLNKDIFYMFELCSPETRFGIIYNTRCLYLIGATSRHTLMDIDIYTLNYPETKAQFYIVGSQQEIYNLMQDTGINIEGYVAIDKNMNRLKFHNPRYVNMLMPDNYDDELQAIFAIMDSVGASSTLPSVTFYV